MHQRKGLKRDKMRYYIVALSTTHCHCSHPPLLLRHLQLKPGAQIPGIQTLTIHLSIFSTTIRLKTLPDYLRFFPNLLLRRLNHADSYLASSSFFSFFVLFLGRKTKFDSQYDPITAVAHSPAPLNPGCITRCFCLPASEN